MPSLPRLCVSDNRRFLQDENGRPFFWLGDTAWELFHRRDLEEAAAYLQNRRGLGFNLIQAVAVPELAGLTQPNRNGDLPFTDLDPAQPVDAYFDHVDRVIQLAADKELYIGLVATWADKVKRMWGGEQEIFNPQNAFAFGQYLGRRFQHHTNLVWILGGDRSAEGVEDIWRAMAAGVDQGAGARTLKTYHPFGGHSSAEWLHQEEWLDFNMIQSGHGKICEPTWEMISTDYYRDPIKPVLDGEPNYEDMPIGFTSQNGYFNDYHVRRQAYRSVFAGGFGVTYGHNSIWQMYDPSHEPLGEPLYTWKEALERPGAAQMVHLKNLILSRPFFSRIPGQDLFLTKQGDEENYVQITRDDECRYLMVYFPQPALKVGVELDLFTSSKVHIWWYDPCSGRSLDEGLFPVRRAVHFTSPQDMPDCVLVVDDADQGFLAPGTF